MISKETLGVLQIGAAFMVLYSAYSAQGFVEQTVIEHYANDSRLDQHAGYYSQSINMASLMLGNLISAPIVDVIGAKLAMFIGSMTFTVFYVGFFFLNPALLYLSSAVAGLGAAVLWTGQGKFLSQISSVTNSKRNSGIFFAVASSNFFIGGIFLLITFQSSSSPDGKGDFINKRLTNILYAGFIVVSLIGNIIFAFLKSPKNPEKINNKLEAKPQKKSHLSLLASTFRLMLTKNALLLAVSFGYTGLEVSFAAGIYGTVVSNTVQLGNGRSTVLALVAFARGIAYSLGAGLNSVIGSHCPNIGSMTMIVCGTVAHSVALALAFLFFPTRATIEETSQIGFFRPNAIIAILIAFLIGLGSACWNVQIYAVILKRYQSGGCSQAFALYNFYQSLFAAIAFFYGGAWNLHLQLAILAIAAIFGVACFIVVETGNNDDDAKINNFVMKHM